MPGILCEHCTGLCCRYISLPVDTPTSKRDFDDIRWFMLHEGVTAYIEDGDWYLNIQTPCRHLLPDHRCGIYETRPAVCRAYTTDNCEYHAGDYDFEHHFVSPADVEAYEREYFRLKRAAGRNGNGAVGRRNGRNGTAGGRKGAKRRRGVRARIGPRRIRYVEPGISGTHDSRGVALPILALPAVGRVEKNGNRQPEGGGRNGNGHLKAPRSNEAPPGKRVEKPVSRDGLETRPTQPAGPTPPTGLTQPTRPTASDRGAAAGGRS